jgi:hypothetical protein
MRERGLMVGHTTVWRWGQRCAPDDENSTINSTGRYRLFIFNIDDRRKYEAMVRNQPRGQALNIDIEAACVVVGIAPMYLGTYRCRGGGGYSGGWKNRT